MEKKFGLMLGLLIFMNHHLAFGHGVTLAKAAELSLHRLERLVAVCNLGDAKLPINIPGQPGYDSTKCKNDPSKPRKGITPDYQYKFFSMSVEGLAHQNEDDPSFKATAYQFKSHNGAQKAVEIILDDEGRPLSYQEVAGDVSQSAPVYQDNDPTTLSENALHYLLNNVGTKPELSPYNLKLQSFTILPSLDNGGRIVGAVIDFSANGESKLLRMRMKANGDFDSLELVSP